MTLQCYDFVQHVAQPTHKAGHTLDLLITRNYTTIPNLRVSCWISDHAPVYFNLCGCVDEYVNKTPGLLPLSIWPWMFISVFCILWKYIFLFRNVISIRCRWYLLSSKQYHWKVAATTWDCTTAPAPAHRCSAVSPHLPYRRLRHPVLSCWLCSDQTARLEAAASLWDGDFAIKVGYRKHTPVERQLHSSDIQSYQMKASYTCCWNTRYRWQTIKRVRQTLHTVYTIFTKKHKNKMLSYRRETAQHGALVLAKSGRLKLGDNILRTL